MSDILRSRPEPERTARVWQPSDFLLGTGAERFQPRRWSESGIPRFVRPPEPQVIVPRPPELDPALLPAPSSSLAPDTEGTDEASAASVTVSDLEEARLQAYAQGQAHAREEAQRQLLQSRQSDEQALRERLAALEAAVGELRLHAEAIHEPLKRLAVHLAEQLVLGELSQSPQAIERLVRRCVDELAGPRQVPVRVHLHPQDLALLQAWMGRSSASESDSDAARTTEPPWVLEADERLAPGSVRASANDAVVSDLIEHRLDALARQLLPDTQRVARQSAFQPDRLAARRAEVDAVLDAQPRMAESPRQNRFSPVVEAQAVPAAPAADPTAVDLPPSADEGAPT